MKENRDKFHLERIMESIDRVEKFLNNANFSDFEKNEMMFDATLMQIINIGETIIRLSNHYKEKHNDLPWNQAIGMRNQIAHGYFEIKPRVVWNTAKKDLPELKKKINNISTNR